MNNFNNESEFVQAANSSFREFFENQLDNLRSMINFLSLSRKPVLTVSYEDIKNNPMSQIVRIAKFIDSLYDEKELIERLICTVLNEREVKVQTERVHKFDAKKSARKMINKTVAYDKIMAVSNDINIISNHFLRLNEYLKSLTEQKKYL